MSTQEFNTSNGVSNKKKNQLYEQITDLTAEERLLNRDAIIFSDLDVRGSRANEIPVIDESDEWK